MYVILKAQCRLHDQCSTVIYLQGIDIYALPEVKEVRFYPRFDPNDNTNVSCPTPLAFTFTSANGEMTTIRITISPLDHPEKVERELNASLVNAGIDMRIAVDVKFFGENGEDVGVSFSFIALTPFGASYSPPKITIETNSSNISCTNLNSALDPIDESLLNSRVEVNTTQNQTFVNTFKIGYENLTVFPGARFTNDLPPDVTADSLQEAISNLFGWDCSNQPSNQASVHKTYEDRLSNNVDTSTSFCGHSSLKNPEIFWEVDEQDALAIGHNPYFVSNKIIFFTILQSLIGAISL